MAKNHRPAGGIGSRNVVSKRVRVGAGARAVHPGGAGLIGTSIGTHVTEKRKETDYRGVPVFGGDVMPSKFGNQIAAATVCGPGGSRNIYRTGVQGQHGNAVQGGPRIANTRGQWPDSK